MITAVDTNVLLDVLLADPTYGAVSKSALRTCLAQGKLIASAVVWAEIAGCFDSDERARQTLDRLGIGCGPLDCESALGAGRAWRRYRAQGGPRQRVVADFLIGAHATAHADRLLTRDRGFYRRYFADLTVMSPSAG